jgi:hypothetical protein
MESLLFAAGGISGCILAWWTIRSLGALDLPIVVDLSLDYRVVILAVGVSLITVDRRHRDDSRLQRCRSCSHHAARGPTSASLHRGPVAVDRERRTRDERRLVRREEERGRRNLLGLRQALHRMIRDERSDDCVGIRSILES